MVDPDGAVQGPFQYQAFGLTASGPDAWQTFTSGQWNAMAVDDWAAMPVQPLPTNFGAWGQKQTYLDPETQLFLLGSGTNGNYYDPATGRFVSEDPTRWAGGDGQNLYRLVGNNPINRVDPGGHDASAKSDSITVTVEGQEVMVEKGLDGRPLVVDLPRGGKGLVVVESRHHDHLILVPAVPLNAAVVDNLKPEDLKYATLFPGDPTISAVDSQGNKYRWKPGRTYQRTEAEKHSPNPSISGPALVRRPDLNWTIERNRIATTGTPQPVQGQDAGQTGQQPDDDSGATIDLGPNGPPPMPFGFIPQPRRSPKEDLLPFAGGLTESVTDPVVSLVTDPLGTLKGLGFAAAHPVDVTEAIFKDIWVNLSSDDPERIGKGLGDALQMLAAGKAVLKGATSAATLLKKVADEGLKVEDVVAAARKAARLRGHVPKDVPIGDEPIGPDEGHPVKAGEGVPAKPPLRLAYEKEVMDLADQRAELQARGKSPEEIARTLSEARRQIGVKYKDLTPPDILEQIYARNLRDYGDKLGPTVDWLVAHGKTWEQIAESATRPGPWPPPWLK